MSSDLEFMWSNTDFPYACLIDKKRTEAFKQAIDATVKPGNIVVEVGAGTGILSLFAANAGAKKVYAVEIDKLLVRTLIETVKSNNLEHIIEVIEGDAMKVDLPKNADVIIAELIETGLMDEMQAPVINDLHSKGIIGLNTKVIPESYVTSIEPVKADESFYGFKIKAPMHMWPNYNQPNEGWTQKTIQSSSDAQKICTVDFTLPIKNLDIKEDLFFKLNNTEKPNAVCISGLIKLADDIYLDDTNTLNGKKIILFDKEVDQSVNKLQLRISYTMGKGLGNFRCHVTQIN